METYRFSESGGFTDRRSSTYAGFLLSGRSTALCQLAVGRLPGERPTLAFMPASSGRRLERIARSSGFAFHTAWIIRVVLPAGPTTSDQRR